MQKLRRRLRDLEKTLKQAWEDKQGIHDALRSCLARDCLLVPCVVNTLVTFSLPWQYQELQNQPTAHSQCLEMKSLQEHLGIEGRRESPTQETVTQTLTERNRTTTQLQSRLSAMAREYENILHGSLDLGLAKMAETSRHWEETGTTITMEHKEHLQELGLTPLEI
ncbi:dynein regulatory complex protein 12 [Melanerpes formicivorus]|uniref:dynein regulatory complex protein 12 n=1 Tax=Melanerpes formicivorus TaxID=211600 RepID=UPI00358FB31F